MRKALTFFLLYFIFLTQQNFIFAQNSSNCSSYVINSSSSTVNENTIRERINSGNVVFNDQDNYGYFRVTINVSDPQATYNVLLTNPPANNQQFLSEGIQLITPTTNGKLEFIAKVNINPEFGVVWPHDYTDTDFNLEYVIWRQGTGDTQGSPYCRVSIAVNPPDESVVVPTTIPISPSPTPINNRSCSIRIDPNPDVVSSINQQYNALILPNDYLINSLEIPVPIVGTGYTYEINVLNVTAGEVIAEKTLPVTNSDRVVILNDENNPQYGNRVAFEKPLSTFSNSTFKVVLREKPNSGLFPQWSTLCESSPFSIGEEPTPTLTEEEELQTSLCRNIPDENPDANGKTEYDKCVECMGKDGDEFQGQVYTAFGCISSTVDGFLEKFVFQIGLGLAGVVAFLLMLWGSFKMIISQGDPQQLQQGREVIVSAGAGLLLIIFSVLIIQFFGFNVLRIPGFGTLEQSPSNDSSRNVINTTPERIQP